MKHKGYIPYLFAAVCTLFYLSLVFNNNVWMDEAFSASIIRCGFKEMVSRTFADTLPPFYNFSAWFFTRIFGFSTIKLKIFSVIPMTLLMLIACRFIPRISSERAACIYIVMITVMPHFFEHGVEIRMYSWAVLFSSAAAVFALCWIRSVPRSGLWLIASTVCGAYTHQYALVAEGFIWLMLLFISVYKKTLKQWFIGAFICIACYIPCAVLTVYQMKRASSYFSAYPATFDSMMSSVRYPYVTNLTVLSTLLLLLVILLFAYACRIKEYISAYYILVYFLVTVLSFGLMRATGSTFFSSRYLLPAVGIMWLGAAVSLDLMISEKRSALIPASLLAGAVLIVIYIQQYRIEYVDMSRFEAFLSQTGDEDGYIMYEEFPEIGICLEYYAPWMRSSTIDNIGDVAGKKYVFVNRTVHTNEIAEIEEKKYELRYIENLAFDRYTFRAYELIRKD